MVDITRFFLSLLTVSSVIFPNIFVSGIPVTRLNITEASALLEQQVTPPKEFIVTLEGQDYPIETKNFDLKYDYLASAQRAYQLVKTGNTFYDLKLKLNTLFNPKNLGLIATYDEEKLNSLISVISAQVSVDPIFPSLSIENKQVVVERGSKGLVLDNEALIASLSHNIAYAK